VYFISKLPVEINPKEYALVAVFSMGICLFFSYFPARSAALIRPADGFRDR
jgi:ABC-type lipoprotein release transport system permease subunit